MEEVVLYAGRYFNESCTHCHQIPLEPLKFLAAGENFLAEQKSVDRSRSNPLMVSCSRQFASAHDNHTYVLKAPRKGWTIEVNKQGYEELRLKLPVYDSKLDSILRNQRLSPEEKVKRLTERINRVKTNRERLKQEFNKVREENEKKRTSALAYQRFCYH